MVDFQTLTYVLAGLLVVLGWVHVNALCRFDDALDKVVDALDLHYEIAHESRARVLAAIDAVRVVK